MQGAFAFGLAKNVNGLPGARRAATAYQIGGRLSSPSTPVNGDGSGSAAFSGWSSVDVDTLEETSPQLAAAVASIPRVASSPLAFADLAREQTVLATSASASVATAVSGSPTSSVGDAPLYPVGEEQHLGKRGTSVDKTNPFIGYFQTGTEEDNSEREVAPTTTATAASPLPPLGSSAPMRRVPCRTQSSAALSSASGTSSSFYPSVFFTPQKKMTEWLPTSRFPAFFKQRDNAGSCYKNKQEQHKHKQGDKKDAQAFLSALKLEASALSVQTTDLEESRPEQQDHKYGFKRTVSMPVVSPATTTTAAAVKKETTASPLSSVTSSHSSCSSRFEQDFEVVGSLGEGGQGAVFKVRSKVDGCYYAIKKVVLPRASAHDSERAESQALREVRSMASMSPHGNVVRYHTAWTEVDPGVEESTSSTESVRGSNVSSLESNVGQQELLHRQQLDLLDEEEELRMSEAQDASFSLDFSSDSLAFDDTYSTPGFSFEDEMSETVGLSVDEEISFGHPGDFKKQVSSRTAEEDPVGLKSQVNLYIQMELCGTSVAPASTSSSTSATSTEEPFHRFLDQLKAEEEQEKQQQSDTEMPSNLAVWLRSSLEKRSSWSRTSPTHLEGLKLFLGAVQGVAHMHSYGVIHRDLKPDNIFIQGDVAKIGDFGLSKSVFADNSTLDGNNNGMRSPRERLQELGRSDEYGDHTTALGTFTYASPEQLGYRFSSSNALKNAASRLKSAKYSIKSDIFALGVILLELCCPFSTMMERSQVLTAVRHGVVPQKARQNFPDEMDLVLRMTAIDPTERPTSEEVCEQLEQLLASSSSSSAVVSPQAALEDLRQLQLKLAAAVRQVRDRSQATLQLEALVSELNDKVQNVGIAFA